MKRLIVFINLLLMIALFGFTAHNFLKKGETEQGFSVKKSSKKAAPAKPQPKQTVRITKEDQESTIVRQNIFNPARNPNVQMGGRSGGQMQLTLVGVTMIGDRKGAIILQKSQNRRFPPFGFPQWGQNNQFNRQGSRQQQQQLAPQQYVRVGEKLPNGYVLTEVTRTGAVLTLNGSRMELKLQEASKNQQQRAARPRQNTTQNILQQMQNMQRMQMMQNMQMMRMMQQNRNQGQRQMAPQNMPAGNRGGSPRRR